MSPTGTPSRVSWVAGSSAYLMPVHRASATIDSSIVMATMPMRSSVVAAFLLLGLRNAGTPLLIASTPVSAAHPDEKARSMRKARANPPRAS